MNIKRLMKKCIKRREREHKQWEKDKIIEIISDINNAIIDAMEDGEYKCKRDVCFNYREFAKDKVLDYYLKKGFDVEITDRGVYINWEKIKKEKKDAKNS